MDKVSENMITRVCCGKCAACDTKALLHEGLCRSCHVKYKDWGPGGWKPEFAEILLRCRKNKAFAYVLYTKLKNTLRKQKFAAEFGLTEVVEAIQSGG